MSTQPPVVTVPADIFEDLVDAARDLICHEPYLAHKYGAPALVARAVAATSGTAPVLECADGCPDCVRMPQELDPLPGAAFEGHSIALSTTTGPVGFIVACSCSQMDAVRTSQSDFAAPWRAHVAAAWTSTTDTPGEDA